MWHENFRLSLTSTHYHRRPQLRIIFNEGIHKCDTMSSGKQHLIWILPKWFSLYLLKVLTCSNVSKCFHVCRSKRQLGGHERWTIDLPTNISEIRAGQYVKVTTDIVKSFTCTARFETQVLLHFNCFILGSVFAT